MRIESVLLGMVFCVQSLSLNTVCEPAELKSEELPSYTVAKTEEKIKIDGLMQESSWEKAGEIKLSYPLIEKDKLTGEDTTVKLLWDEENLYVFFKCRDTNIWAEHEARDSNVCQDDCVEFFISPDSETVHIYFNFEVNAKGVFLDHARIVDRTPWIVLTKWDATVESGHAIKGTLNNSSGTDEFWTMEMAIPFSNFSRVAKKPAIGDRWRMNLNRINRLGEKEEYQYSQWAISDHNKVRFHAPEKFGFIQFSGSHKGK